MSVADAERISVVIPCLNGAAFLGEAIRSALSQTLPPYQIIVIDDGSKDGSAALAEAFGPPVRVVRGPHRGASASRRRGAEIAGFGRLMFLDADDLISPDTLEGLSTALDASPEAVAVCAWDRFVKEGPTWIAYPPSAAPPRPGQDALDGWLTETWSPPCAVMWSGSAYRRSGGWSERSSPNDDGELMMRALIRGVRLVSAPVGLALYRRPPDGAASLSLSGRHSAGLAARFEGLEEIGALLSEAGLLPRHRAALVEAFGQIRDGGAARPELRLRIEEAISRFGGERVTDGPKAAFGRAAARAAAGLRDRSRPRRPVPCRIAKFARPLGTEAPMVSVVIPSFNRAHVVTQAIASVGAQNYPRVEIIVVDDGSTDGTAEMLRASDDPALRVIALGWNEGVAAARNRGAEAARGDYIAFLDSDDVWLPGTLGPRVEALASAPPHAGVSYGGCEIVHRDGTVERVVPRHEGRLFEGLLLANLIEGGGSSIVIRRTVWQVVGGFDPRLPAVEDWDWLQRAARLYDFRAIDVPVLRYRLDDDPTRRSMNFRANMDARAMLHRRNRHALRRAGVEHLYLLESARRELKSAGGDAGRGRKLVLAAWVARPWEQATWIWLVYMLAPAPLRTWLRAVDGRIGPAAWRGRASVKSGG